MGLFKPAWMSDKPSKKDKAYKEISREKNQDKLKEIALNAPQSGVGEMACSYITDPLILAEIAKHGKYYVARKAVSLITDYKILKDVALNAVRGSGGSFAVEKISSQDELIDIALNASEEYSRYDALKRVSNKSIIAEIAQNDESGTVRLKALEYVSDPAVLESIARNDISHYVRNAALDKIDDKSLYADIIHSWSEEQKRETEKANNLNNWLRTHGKPQGKPGCCPHCGVRLAMRPPNLPDNAVLYCSNCKKRLY